MVNGNRKLIDIGCWMVDGGWWPVASGWMMDGGWVVLEWGVVNG